MSELFRAQILLERSQRDALMGIARKKRKSMSAILREILAEYLDRQEYLEREQTLKTLEELRALREKQPLYEGDPIAEIRAERERQMDDLWRQS